MMISVQNTGRSLKLIFFQMEVKNNEKCLFLMINVKKTSLNGLYVFKKASENLRKNSPRHSPAIPGKVLIFSTALSK